jgi:hypothetical protein
MYVWRKGVRKMGKFVLLVLALTIPFNGCIAREPQAQKALVDHASSPLLESKADVYAIYSELLADLYVDDSALPNLIAGSTSLDSLSQETLNEDLLSSNRTGASADTVRDFIESNSTPQRLTCEFKVKVQCILLNAQELHDIGQEGGWNRFLSKYPGQSVITLSRVGFNTSKDEALVYTGSQSGGRTGKGYYVLLVRTGNVWKTKRKVAAWVS